MMLFSVAVSLPVLLSLRRLGRVYLAAEVTVGLINIALGVWILYANG